MIRFARVVAVLTVLVGLQAGRSLAGGMDAPREQTTGQAVPDVVALFDRTPLVAIGESHGLRDLHLFFQELIADPAFGRTVNDIVVEFGNARYQAIADAFVLNQRPVSRPELQQVWRNTTQSMVNTWDAPIYEQFFQAVRRANLTRPAGQPAIRVILGDPPIDWSAIHTMKDYLPFVDRDGFYARTVEREVLGRGHRALLVAGLGHVVRSSSPGRSVSAAQQIETRHPGTVSVLMPYLGFPASLRAAGDRLLREPAPTLISTKTPWLGALNATDVFGGPPQAPLGMEAEVWRQRLGQVVDGVIVLGDPATFTMSVTDPAIYGHPAFAAEVLRRKRIFGFEDHPTLGMKALQLPENAHYFQKK